MEQVKKNITDIKSELNDVEEQMEKCLEGLGLYKVLCEIRLDNLLYK